MSKELEVARELVRMLEEKERTGMVELSSVSVGEIISANDNRYKVLEHFENGTTLIVPMAFILESVKFDSDGRDYKTSNLRKQIEEKCLPVFEKDFGAENLIEHEVDLTSVDMQNEFGTCTCKTWPGTFDEVRKYNNLLVNEALKGWWWTCTPWSTEERGWKYSVAVVSASGDFNFHNCNCDYGVRPFCILKSNIFVSKGE